MNNRIINKNEQDEAIRLPGFYYKLFEEGEGGGTREGLDGYTYLKHIIQYWPVDWTKQVSKMNKAVGMNNLFTVDG